MTLNPLWLETKENNYEKNKIHLLLVVSSISGLPYNEVTNIVRKDRKAKDFRSPTILHRQNYANLSQLENSCLSWESPAVTQTSSVAFYCLYCFHPGLIKQSLRTIYIGRNVTEDKSSFDILIDIIDINTDGSYRLFIKLRSVLFGDEVRGGSTREDQLVTPWDRTKENRTE